jgi:hypothetical protein
MTLWFSLCAALFIKAAAFSGREKVHRLSDEGFTL